MRKFWIRCGILMWRSDILVNTGMRKLRTENYEPNRPASAMHLSNMLHQLVFPGLWVSLVANSFTALAFRLRTPQYVFFHPVKRFNVSYQLSRATEGFF
jgi:hypothetical protein